VELAAVELAEVEFRAVEFSEVQFRAVELREVEFRAVEFKAVEFSAVEFSAVEFSAVEFSAVELREVQFRAFEQSAVPLDVSAAVELEPAVEFARFICAESWLSALLIWESPEAILFWLARHVAFAWRTSNGAALTTPRPTTTRKHKEKSLAAMPAIRRDEGNENLRTD